ncbi:MAG: YdiU family protein [Cyanobacteria bacterium J083]|nr:MAG: YdiU family protein [Cyanobacteria bacterium J083]
MTSAKSNPFFQLEYLQKLENLGDDYYDVVAAAKFPQHILRFRNDQLLPKLGLEPREVKDEDFINAFGKFDSPTRFLALRYHGYQFGVYNPQLGDGRGFLYGQVKGKDGKVYDLGTKGSGTTPYSRGGDGRLTLKGGVREVLAAEALHQLGVNTSRCLSLIETGEALWRGDEPSPTRSSVMVRFSQSHIRFGTLERLYYLQRADLIGELLNHVIDIYYPEVEQGDTLAKYVEFYHCLVKRIAQLVAQWMAAGFCHGVLNTDNMSITGESFDYGPYAFIPNYNRQFTAAYFDYSGMYSYGNQPFICRLNLERLQKPLSLVIPRQELVNALSKFEEYYESFYYQLMLQKLGFTQFDLPEARELFGLTIKFLNDTEVGYHEFFAKLAEEFNYGWQQDSNLILENTAFSAQLPAKWRKLYQQILNQLSPVEMKQVGDRLPIYNPATALLRPVIESVWQPIVEADNWQPFNDLLAKLRNKQ